MVPGETTSPLPFDEPFFWFWGAFAVMSMQGSGNGVKSHRISSRKVSIQERIGSEKDLFFQKIQDQVSCSLSSNRRSAAFHGSLRPWFFIR